MSLLKRMLPRANAPGEPQTASESSRPDYVGLVSRIIVGDPDAEEELVALFKARIVHIILRITNNTSLVEDFSQDTFLIVIRKIRNGDVKKPESLGPFVASVARNHAIEQIREIKRPVSEDLELAEQVPDPSPSPLEQLQVSERLDEIREVIGELRPRDKVLIFRFYIKEEPKVVICSDLGLTGAQFDRVLHRARNRLAALYLKRKAREKV